MKKDQTETEAFKRWFGDSKVVDEDGKPLVVYHFSDANFNEFDRERLGENTKGNTDSKEAIRMAELGFWLANRDITWDGAKGMFADIGYPVYLSMKNPRIYQTFDSMWTASRALKTGEKWKASLESQGYDGVILKKDTEFNSVSYIVFSPTQIKSATGNRGTFDPETPDIRFSLKDLRETAGDIQKTLRTIATPVKGREGDAGGFLAQVLSSPEWIQHPVIQKIVEHNLERSETRHEIHYDISTDDNGESIIGKMDRMRKDKKMKPNASDSTPAWNAVSILARPEGRAQRRSPVRRTGRRPVSILARPEGRAQRTGGCTKRDPFPFQSSPAPKDGRNVRICPRCKSHRWFQSSPAPKDGRNFQISDTESAIIRVSILARPEGRAQLLRPSSSLLQILVSILARPEGRAQPSRRRRRAGA